MSLDLGVLVSGNGTNLQAILDAIAAKALDARVRLVVSNKPGVQALERARRAGVAHSVISHSSFASREAFDGALVEALQAASAEWIVLAGFMRVLTPRFLQAFSGRVVNIHPSLLPAFPGTHAQRQALDYGVKVTGCTVHIVDLGVDTGPVLAQRAVPVLDQDDEATLSERIHSAEHALLVQVLQSIAAGRVQIVQRGAGERPRVFVRPE
jgi:phosphoribosylglycinamide formyltransferase-1